MSVTRTMRVLQIGVLFLLLIVLAAPAVHAQSVRTHTVKRGDTLYSLSQRYDLSVEELRRLNGLQGNTIKVGQQLIVGRREEGAAPASPPPSPEPSAASGETQQVTSAEGDYTARPGDTFYTIAARYGLSADTLFALNDRRTAPLEPGQPVRLPGQQSTAIHRVRSGETLVSIATQYGVSLQALREANDVEGSRIYTGQELRIPTRQTRPQRQAGVLPPADTTGPVLSYPPTFAGRLTASGAPYQPDQYTASHPHLPLGSIVLLSNPKTGQHTFAKVNDRGPIDDNYLMEISDAVARQLGLRQGSEQPIELRILR